MSSGARAHGGPASRPYRPPVTAHVRQTTIRVRVEKKIGRREGTQTHRLSTAKLYSGKPGLRGSDATSGRWQVRQGSSSRTNLRRPIRAGKRRPKSYAGLRPSFRMQWLRNGWANAWANGWGRSHARQSPALPSFHAWIGGLNSESATGGYPKILHIQDSEMLCRAVDPTQSVCLDQ